MATKLRETLNTIDRALSDPEISEDLWDILSGLRGPDTAQFSLKLATTSVLRYHAFPRTFKQMEGMYTGAVAVMDDEGSLQFRRSMANAADGYHFRHHAYKAFRALGLAWDELNKPTDEVEAV